MQPETIVAVIVTSIVTLGSIAAYLWTRKNIREIDAARAELKASFKPVTFISTGLISGQPGVVAQSATRKGTIKSRISVARAAPTKARASADLQE